MRDDRKKEKWSVSGIHPTNPSCGHGLAGVFLRQKYLDMEKHDKNIHMLGLVERWMQSGQSQREFVREQKIKLATFSYWVTKYRQGQQGQNSFSRIELSQTPAPQRMAKLEIALADGMVVRIF